MVKNVDQSPRRHPQMSCFVHDPNIISLGKKPENIHFYEAGIREF